ncbi:MAG: hypothetical protein K8L99_31525 [Anaerolineae bacterium]|nr:hypothetical protein [Anaerolineae bacterium]
MLEHEHMVRMRREHPDWIWNRSDNHVILGVPGSHEAFKTPVEPGNTFSPGVGSYGVSTWVYTANQLHTPEERPLDQMDWSFLNGRIPVLISHWKADSVEVTSRLFTDGDAELTDIKDYLAVQLHNPTSDPIEMTFYLVIRSFGAAGAAIRSLAWEDNSLRVNGGAPVLYASQPPDQFGALAYTDSQSDISAYLKLGKLPSAASVSDEATWASGALAYDVALQPGESHQFDFVCHVHANHPKLKWLKPPQKNTSVDQQQRNFVEHWQQNQKIQLDLPDKRFENAFFAQINFLNMFTVYNQPRISPISYPLWWLRDGSYAIIALDKGGYHDFAERAVRGAAHRDAFGGFGAEGDGPSESIWMLSEHYLLTRSQDYLRDVYPDIERKADLLIRMIQTDVAITGTTEIRTPQMMLAPDSDLMCLPADDGMIMGRMDGHFPIMWINAFAYLGLKRAAFCAAELGLDGSRFEDAAKQLRKTMKRRAPELFNKNDRDTNSAFWPTNWASRDDENIQRGFEQFWNEVRCPQGVYTREPLWTYFEAGQAHNYLLLGQPERTWTTIEHFLTEQIAPGLYTYSEGDGDENSSLQWQRTRGWDQIRYVTPHGWTAAEVFLLLRDCLAREEDNKLIIGSGIPETWLTKSFSVRNLPTYFGNLSFHYEPDNNKLEVELERRPSGGIQVEFPAVFDAEAIGVNG